MSGVSQILYKPALGWRKRRINMSKEREALKLALEALELHLTHHEHGCVYLDPAVTAIKEALMSQSDEAQPEQYITDAMKVRQAVAQALLDDVYAEELEKPEAKLEQEPVACVYKATTKKGEVAHFGEYSAAKAWAGWGTVERVPLKTLIPISKSTKPCPTCESLARSVMLDQTSHDTISSKRTWVGLTDEEIIIMSRYDLEYAALIGEVQRKLKEKNTNA